MILELLQGLFKIVIKIFIFCFKRCVWFFGSIKVLLHNFKVINETSRKVAKKREIF